MCRNKTLKSSWFKDKSKPLFHKTVVWIFNYQVVLNISSSPSWGKLLLRLSSSQRLFHNAYWSLSPPTFTPQLLWTSRGACYICNMKPSLRVLCNGICTSLVFSAMLLIQLKKGAQVSDSNKTGAAPLRISDPHFTGEGSKSSWPSSPLIGSLLKQERGL